MCPQKVGRFNIIKSQLRLHKSFRRCLYPEHEGQFLKIIPFYKILIISTLLLSGFILCYLVLSKTAYKFACKQTYKRSECASKVLPFHSPGQAWRPSHKRLHLTLRRTFLHIYRLWNLTIQVGRSQSARQEKRKQRKEDSVQSHQFQDFIHLRAF